MANKRLCYTASMGNNPTDEEVARVMAFIGRKGGRAKVPKGFAKMSRERFAEVQRRGSEAARRKRADQKKT